MAQVRNMSQFCCRSVLFSCLSIVKLPDFDFLTPTQRTSLTNEQRARSLMALIDLLLGLLAFFMSETKPRRKNQLQV